MKSFLNLIFSRLQKIGQSLMIPVSVLPAAGLLVALGRILQDVYPDKTSFMSTIANVLYLGGLAIFEQLPVVFAMGVAVGFAHGAGVAALSAGVGYFTLVNVLKVISGLHPSDTAINTGVFGGILIGAVVASIYNRFHKTQLHPVFGFFSGKRLVPIMSVAAALFVGLVLGWAWPPIQLSIQHFGQNVMSSDFGPALYAAGKRLLIPLGLHHVYYPPFLFEFGEFMNSAGQMVRGESARYFAGDPSAGKFMASEFPLMLFGLPAACLAMYFRARKENRKAIAGVMLSAALTSIITGITEPIEFAFIFVAPILFVLHVGLAFVSGFLTHIFDVHLGYTFSASLIDFGLGYFNQKNSSYLWMVIGPVIGLCYFGGFYTLIGLLNLKTPGRDVSEEAMSSSVMTSGNSQKALDILMALGGGANIRSIDACITRLRLVVVQPDLVDKSQLKKLGATGTLQSGNSVQVIFGVESDLLKDQIKAAMALSLLSSPLEGEVLKLEEVPDETFAQKFLGEGFAIRPKNGVVRAPCVAEVVHLFPTNHAIALKTDLGMEILIHIGIDTVKMNGEGFKSFVKIGDRVQTGQTLIEFDLNLVRQKAKSDITPIVITNMDQVSSLKMSSLSQVGPSQVVMQVEMKKDMQV